MKLWNLIISFSSWKSQWFREIVHNQKIGQKSIIPIWLVVSNVNVIFHFIYGMSSFPLTNSIIFQDGFCITNQPWITPQKIRKNHQKIQTNKKITRKSRKNPEKTKKTRKSHEEFHDPGHRGPFAWQRRKSGPFEATTVQKNYGKICGLMWFNGIVCLFLFTLLQI